VLRSQTAVMRAHLLEAAERSGGVLTRAAALRLAGRHVLDDAVRVGALRHLYPGVYIRAEQADDVLTRQRAALAYVPESALSHVDALFRWRVPVPPQAMAAQPLTLTTATRGQVAVKGLRVVRRQWFQPRSHFVAIRGDDPVVRLEQALIESWPLLTDADRRGPLIWALQRRLTTVERLNEVLALQPRTPGAAQLRQVIDLVGAGCHSELELWGHEQVFRDRRLPPSQLQVPISLRSGTIYLDRYFPTEMVNVELDGAAFHGSAQQRERDLRRDAELARMGILVVRWSHERLHAEPAKLIQELVETLRMRRQQLRQTG
jgi:very-short-patch-repair endonuclease